MDSAPEQLHVPEPQASQLSEESLYEFASSGFEIPPLPPPSTVNRIFIGPYGLRAGWSLLIYFAILAAIVFGVRAIHDYNKAKAHQAVIAAQAAGTAAPAAAPAKHDPNAPEPVRSVVFQEGITFAFLLILSLLMAVIERRKVSAFGLGGARAPARFFVGSAWGFICLSLLVLTLRAFHLLSFDAQLDHGWAIVGWGGAQLVGFLIVGLVEEYLFRGYLQFTLTRGLLGIGSLISRPHARTIAFWLATVITSALFFFAHTGNDGEDKMGLFLVFLAGIVFVLALWRTGSLWWGIGFHMAWDWSQSFLYGVPDSGLLVQGRLFSTHATGSSLLSGGTAGPEGSVFCFPILLLVIGVLLFTRSSPQPPLETKLSADSLAHAPTQAPVTLVA